VSGYKLRIRVRGKVERQRHPALPDALDALAARAGELSREAHAAPEGGGIMRRITPVQQVVGRLEVAGPHRLRAGLDVRGDGSTEAWTGQLRRQVVEPREGESAVDALRRTLAETSR
jgi:hypothetical protein